MSPDQIAGSTSNSGAGCSSASSAVASLTPFSSMKLPTFSPEAPELFFLLMDATFAQQKVTDPNIKFLTTLMQLPQRVQMQAKGLISEDVDNKLSKLKEIVSSLYVVPVEQRLKQLLSSTSMGDMKPTEYLQYLRELQGSDADPNSPLIRTYFLDSLPTAIIPFVRLMFSSHDLDAIAKAADNSVPYVKPNTACNIDVVPYPSPSLLTKFDELADKVSAIASQHTSSSTESLQQELRSFRLYVDSKFDSIQSQLDTLDRRFSSQQSFDRSHQYNNRSMRNRSNSRVGHNFVSDRVKFCFYHTKFGDKAHKCVKPCSYTCQGNQ